MLLAQVHRKHWKLVYALEDLHAREDIFFDVVVEPGEVPALFLVCDYSKLTLFLGYVQYYRVLYCWQQNYNLVWICFDVLIARLGVIGVGSFWAIVQIIFRLVHFYFILLKYFRLSIR